MQDLPKADIKKGKCGKARFKECAGKGNRGNRKCSEEIGKKD